MYMYMYQLVRIHLSLSQYIDPRPHRACAHSLTCTLRTNWLPKRPHHIDFEGTGCRSGDGKCGEVTLVATKDVVCQKNFLRHRRAILPALGDVLGDGDGDADAEEEVLSFAAMSKALVS